MTRGAHLRMSTSFPSGSKAAIEVRPTPITRSIMLDDAASPVCIMSDLRTRALETWCARSRLTPKDEACGTSRIDRIDDEIRAEWRRSRQQSVVRCGAELGRRSEEIRAESRRGRKQVAADGPQARPSHLEEVRSRERQHQSCAFLRVASMEIGDTTSRLEEIRAQSRKARQPAAECAVESGRVEAMRAESRRGRKHAATSAPTEQASIHRSRLEDIRLESRAKEQSRLKSIMCRRAPRGEWHLAANPNDFPSWSSC